MTLIKTSLKILLLLLLLFPLNSSLQAQIDKGMLSSKSKIVTTEIAPSEKHQYKIKLGKEQLAFFKLLQQGVDVTVDTYNPEGEKMGHFDTPNGKHGPELFTIASDKKGTYVIEVSPYDENEPKSKYSIKVEKVKDKSTLPSEQVADLFNVWYNKETPGVAVAIVQDGKISYKNGFGMANLEYDIPITPTSVFHIASISKQFTAFSILLLEEEGKLSLDDDIRKYIPEVPDFGTTITLRHLANHTSGLRDHWSLLALAGWRLDDVITTEHILTVVSHQKELNFEPGEEFSYCNTGFALLAEVVARVSKQSFAEFTQANIFTPLKMSNSLFYDDHEKIVKNRAYSYQADGLHYKNRRLNFANVGATSLFTTVEDLSLWALNFDTPKVGSKKIIKKLNTLATLNNGETFTGALGQFVGEYKGLHKIDHGGADAGYRANFVRFPEQNFAVMVFGNDAAFNPVNATNSIADIYLKDKFKETPASEEEPKPESPAAEKKTFDKTAVNLADFTGSFYSEELQTTYTLLVEKDQLIARHFRMGDIELIPTETDFFLGASPSFRQIKFTRNKENKITGLKVSAGRVRDLKFEKVK